MEKVKFKKKKNNKTKKTPKWNFSCAASPWEFTSP